MTERQHSIDLLPESIRAQSEAGQRTGRYIGASVAVALLLVVTATHARISLSKARERLQTVKSQASQVESIEIKTTELRQVLRKTEEFIDVYQRIALPLDVSSVIATLVNSLPASVTLDQLDIDAGARMITRSPRSKEIDGKTTAPPRILNGEVSGFATSDQQIAELVQRLDSTPPFRDVSLDFSRTRLVRERTAREFRVSFRIDLDTMYIDRTALTNAARVGEEGADVE